MTRSASRAIGRIAWRESWRAPWRSGLIMMLVALPVAGLSAGAVAVRTSVPTDAERVREEIGSSDIVASADETSTIEQVRAVLPAGSVVASRAEIPAERPIVQGGQVTYLTLSEYSIDLGDAPVAGIHRMVGGRPPARSGEVALHPDVLSALAVSPGDSVNLFDGFPLRITGSVVLAGDLDEATGVLGPGTLHPMGATSAQTWMIDLPPGTDPEDARALLGRVSIGLARTPEDVLREAILGRREVTAGVFAATCLALLAAGLICGAAFSVGARRQLRLLGLLGAVGGERAHSRLLVLMGGLFLGFAGSVIGVALGVAATFALRSSFDRLAGRYVGSIEVPIIPLVAGIALGTVAATIASWGPARAAGRLDVVEALVERTPPPRRPGRVAAQGAVLAVLAAVVTIWGTTTQAEGILTVGLGGMVVGILLAIPVLLFWLGRLAVVLPALARIATRDVARHGRRTGAALAAASIALGAPVAIAALTLADEANQQRIPFLSEDHLSLFGIGSPRRAAASMPAVVDRLRTVFPGAIVVQLHPAASLDESGRERPVLVQGRPEVAPDGSTYQVNGYVLIGDANLLRAYHAEDGIDALEQGFLVGLGPGSLEGKAVDLSIQGSGPVIHSNLPATEAGDSRYGSLGFSDRDLVIAPERAAELGLFPSTRPSLLTHAVLRAPGALSSDDIERARRTVSEESSIGIVSREDLGANARFARSFSIAAGVSMSIAIVIVVVALLAAESHRDLAILAAIGAGPGARRLIGGFSAVSVGVITGVLGLALGLLPSVLYLLARTPRYPIVVPWPLIICALVAVPVIAGLVGGLTARRSVATQLLHPLT